MENGELRVMAKNKNTVVEPGETTTEIEAPYELPEGWKWCKLGNLCDLLNGFAFKSSDYVDESNVMNFRMSQIRPGGFTDLYHNTKYLPDSYADKYKDFLLNDGDVVIAMTDMANDAKILGVPTIVYTDGYKLLLNQRVGKLFNISKSIDSKFLNYMLVSPYIFNYYRSLGKGGLQLNISKPDILNANIPLPSTLEEQQRIVNRIETLFAKLDQAKEKAQNVVDTFETRKASILHKAFNNQLKIDNGELKDEDWIETTIGECCKLGSGGTPSKSHLEYYENGDIPWLNTGEIDWNEISTVEKKITQIGVDNSSAKLYPAESVVVAMYGMGVTRGKAAIIKIPTTTNQAVCVLQTGEKLNNRFLFYYFMCNYWNFREKAVGGNQLNYSATMISKWKIKLPPINYQLSIVNFLDGILEKETKAKEAAEAVLEQIDLLKKSILARAFRGEL